jgi:23S rRNA (uracil1939-C5)-methyltransferase
LHRLVTDRILLHPFERITYISCDCASFARDLRVLKKRYGISKLMLLDLFPQTFHFEIICLLTPREPEVLDSH